MLIIISYFFSSLFYNHQLMFYIDKGIEFNYIKDLQFLQRINKTSMREKNPLCIAVKNKLLSLILTYN